LPELITVNKSSAVISQHTSQFNSTMSFNMEMRTGDSRTINGCYIIVDNGYLQWSTTVPLQKSSLNRSKLRFLQWLESLQKDVECMFGTLKVWWRILKTGIHLHNTEIVDNIWMMCCAFHNILLHVDGLSDGWKKRGNVAYPIVMLLILFR
jgi:hypothetical protein